MKTMKEIAKKYYATYESDKYQESALFFHNVEDFEAARKELSDCEVFMFTRKAGQKQWTMCDKAFELFDVADFLAGSRFDDYFFLSKNEVLEDVENILEDCCTNYDVEQSEIQRLQNFLKEVEQMEFGENKIAIVYDDYSKIELMDRFSCGYYDDENGVWYSLGFVRFFD